MQNSIQIGEMLLVSVDKHAVNEMKYPENVTKIMLKIVENNQMVILENNDRDKLLNTLTVTKDKNIFQADKVGIENLKNVMDTGTEEDNEFILLNNKIVLISKLTLEKLYKDAMQKRSKIIIDSRKVKNKLNAEKIKLEKDLNKII